MIDFEEYIRQTEPGKKEKGFIWQTAIGLQQVDGLKPSAYLIQTAIQNIEGDITFEEVKNRIDAYYKTQVNRQIDGNDRTEEADKVSARIAEILSEKTFSFTPLEYINIHRRLFFGIYKFAGKIRDYNTTKAEWALDGETVYYSSAPLVKETLKYDFKEEKNFIYKGVTKQERVEHIARFISGVWQIHAFGEGNTRTTAVFAIKYLRTFGFNVENEPFAQHSWYFRNALVRANYNNHAKNIYATTKYLNRFFENLLLDEKHILKNRELHIHFVPTDNVGIKQKNDNENNEKFGVNSNKFGVKFGVRFGVNQEKILSLIENKPTITANEMAKLLGISERAIEKNLARFKEQNVLVRIGSDKTGSWKILITEDDK
ncbi:MAG: Fic family protein [Bacteroidales bacterium]|jgi:fido (protein-threonine AMPylation protein)|nr:Fic family protein [Bacteroidales bacterium]